MIRFVRLGVFRFISSLALSLVLVVSSLSSVMAAEQATYTPQDYVEYLTERGKEDPEALKVRQQFLDLSDEDQQKFINYMNDPNILEEMLNTPMPENSRKELHGGDIVIEHKSETEVISETEEVSQAKESKILHSITALCCGSCFASPATKTFKVSHTKIVKPAGVKISSYTVWSLYTARGGVVRSIKDGDGYYSNYWPVSTNKSSVKKYIYGNKAQTCIIWKITPPILREINLGFYNFNIHHDVMGNAQGGKSYRFWKS